MKTDHYYMFIKEFIKQPASKKVGFTSGIQLHGNESTHDAMGYYIDPSWRTLWAISYSSHLYIKDFGMCHSVYGTVYIKEPLLLTEKNTPCNGSSWFPVSLGGPLPYVQSHTTVNQNVSNVSLNNTFPSFLSFASGIWQWFNSPGTCCGFQM